MIGIDVTDINISFNYNKPIDTNNLMNNLKLQYDMGAISTESILRNSPYITDVDREIKNLSENKDNKESTEDSEDDTKQNSNGIENRNNY